MAQLSEHDRRVLLGDDYARIEKEEAAARKQPETREEKLKFAAGQLDRNSERRPGAIAILVTGALIALLHLRQTHQVDLTTEIGFGLAVVGALWFGWLIAERKKWSREMALNRAARPA